MKNHLLLISLLAASVSWAEGKGNGGVDVKTRDGRRIPFETYFANHSRTVNHVCEMVDVEKSYGDSRDWRRSLNHAIDVVYRKLPGAGELLLKALPNMEIYFLDLEEGDSLVSTKDEGGFVQTAMENGALQIPGRKEVIFLSRSWRNYWDRRIPSYEYQNMLTRVFHEALIPYYKESEAGFGKFFLGKAVVELLRMGNFYPADKGHPNSRLKDKKPEEVAHFLRENGIFPDRVEGVSENYLFKLDLLGSGIEVASKQVSKSYYSSGKETYFPNKESWAKLEGEAQQYFAYAKEKNILERIYWYEPDGKHIGSRNGEFVETLSFYSPPNRETKALIEALVERGVVYRLLDSTGTYSNLAEYSSHRINPQLKNQINRLENPPPLCPL